jgi:hypothetical protein
LAKIHFFPKSPVISKLTATVAEFCKFNVQDNDQRHKRKKYEQRVNSRIKLHEHQAREKQAVDNDRIREKSFFEKRILINGEDHKTDRQVDNK